MNITKDLLTDNKHWNFYSRNWQQTISVLWEGETSFKDVLNAMREKLGEGFMYERQVQINDAQITFS